MHPTHNRSILPAGADRDLICPICYQPIPGTIHRIDPTRYGFTLRTYYGWCESCKCSHEVQQFQQHDRWHIHRYRPYTETVAAGIYVPDWQHTVNPLPLPPVMTGPGGDYDKPCTDTELEQLALGFTQVLHTLNQWAAALLRVLRDRSQPRPIHNKENRHEPQ